MGGAISRFLVAMEGQIGQIAKNPNSTYQGLSLRWSQDWGCANDH
jgi:hypothetical protein